MRRKGAADAASPTMNADTAVPVGVDLGGTEVEAALVDCHGPIHTAHQLRGCPAGAMMALYMVGEWTS